MNFFNKPVTVESLMKKCNGEYSTFLSYLSKAHHESYYEFKCQLKSDMQYTFQEISKPTDQNITIGLLTHLNEQLTFINKNTFSADINDLKTFMEGHYPYQEKVNAISQPDIAKKNLFKF